MKSLSLILESSNKPVSCGALLYYKNEDDMYFLLAHPGGPYYYGTDLGSWSIPKGINETGQSDLECAKREVREETGINIDGNFEDIGYVDRPHKKYHIFSLEVSEDVFDEYKNETVPPSNMFELEGQEYPEIDKISFFESSEAVEKADNVAKIFVKKVISKHDIVL